MSRTVEDRRDVGTCDLGLVTVHHFANENGERYQVRAGNHTVLTTSSRVIAHRAAEALTATEEPDEPAEAAEEVRPAARRR